MRLKGFSHDFEFLFGVSRSCANMQNQLSCVISDLPDPMLYVLLDYDDANTMLDRLSSSQNEVGQPDLRFINYDI